MRDQDIPVTDQAFAHPKPHNQMASRECKRSIGGENRDGPSLGIKQRGRWASIAEPADAQPNLPAFAFAAQLYPGHPVSGFVGVSGRNKARVLLLPAAAVAKLDLVYVHGNNSPNWPLLRFTAFGSAHRGYGAGRFAGRAAIESPMRICRRRAPKSSIRVD
jgi:hypothetical protein